MYEKCPPHLNTLRCKNITFHTFIMHSENITCCIKHVAKHKLYQVQAKQIESHKVCSKCPLLAQTQARKGLGHWSTVSSISDCSKLHHTCSRRCRSSSMSWTLVSYTRCWMTDQMAQSTRFRSGGFGGHMSLATKSAVVRHSSSMLCHMHDGQARCPAENKVTSCLRHQ